MSSRRRPAHRPPALAGIGPVAHDGPMPDTDDSPGMAQDLCHNRPGRRLATATPAQAQASEDASVGYGVITVDGTGLLLDAGSWAAHQPGAIEVFTR